MANQTDQRVATSLLQLYIVHCWASTSLFTLIVGLTCSVLHSVKPLGPMQSTRESSHLGL